VHSIFFISRLNAASLSYCEGITPTACHGRAYLQKGRAIGEFGEEEVHPSTSIDNYQHYWPNMADDADGDVADPPPVSHHQELHEQESSQHDDDEPLGESVLNDFVKWCDENLPQAQLNEVQQEAISNEGITLHAGSSSTLNNDKDIHAFQFNFPATTSSPADESMGNEGTNAISAVGSRRHNSNRMLSGIERGIIDGEGMEHIGYRVLDQGSSMANTLLNTPAWPNNHDNQSSASNSVPQFSCQPQDPELVYPQHPAVAHQLTPANQQQMSQASLGKADGTSVGQAPTSNMICLSDMYHMSWRSQSSSAALASNDTSLSDVSRRPQPFYPPPMPTSTDDSVGNGSWNINHRQRSRSEAAIAPGSYPFPQHSHAIPNLPNSYFERQMINEAIAKANDELFPTLRKEIRAEVRLHFRLLTSYFSHVYKFLLRDDRYASYHALRHWLRCAKHWERTVPLEWKFRMPDSITDDTVLNVMCRNNWIHCEMEKERRQNLPLALQQQHSRESDMEFKLTAFREQAKVMRVWTRMFEGMLWELRFNFPLFEDALREFYLTDNWSHLDAPRC
jgi:hypothetical protein